LEWELRPKSMRTISYGWSPCTEGWRGRSIMFEVVRSPWMIWDWWRVDRMEPMEVIRSSVYASDGWVGLVDLYT
jgi:hypothetical protein